MGRLMFVATLVQDDIIFRRQGQQQSQHHFTSSCRQKSEGRPSEANTRAARSVCHSIFHFGRLCRALPAWTASDPCSDASIITLHPPLSCTLAPPPTRLPCGGLSPLSPPLHRSPPTVPSTRPCSALSNPAPALACAAYRQPHLRPDD